MSVLVTLVVAPAAVAASIGTDGTTLRFDASTETREARVVVGFDNLSAGLFFNANTETFRGPITPGAGCAPDEQQAGIIRCRSEGVSVVEIRGPRTTASYLSLDLYESEGIAPPVTGAVYAGAGRDRIYSTNDTADTLSCGGGLDTVSTDARDTIQADCELSGERGGRIRARLLPGHPLDVRAPRSIGSGERGRPYGLAFTVKCPRSTPDDSCGGKLDVFVAEPSAKGTTFFGNEVYSINRGETRRVIVSVGVGAADGQNAANYQQQIRSIRAALKKRGTARMRAQVRTGSSRFQHRFSVRSIRTP